MHARRNAALGEVDVQRVAMRGANHVVVAGGGRVVAHDRRFEPCETAERLVIATDDGEPLAVVTLEFGELGQADACRDVVHMALESELPDIVVPAIPLTRRIGSIPRALRYAHPAEAAQPLRVLLGSRGNQPALACREIFDGVKTEARVVADRSKAAAAMETARAVRAILDHEETPALRDVRDPVHIAGVSAVVHCHDRLRLRRHQRLDLRRVDVERIGLDVAEHRNPVFVQNRVVRRDECHRRRDDFTTVDVRELHRKHQRGGARIERDAEWDADEFREPSLELGDLGTESDPSRLERLADLLELLVAERRFEHRDRSHARQVLF